MRPKAAGGFAAHDARLLAQNMLNVRSLSVKPNVFVSFVIFVLNAL
jgi:hypothetical protein